MAVQDITFEHFFVEVQSKMPEYMFRTLNPYNMKFLKSSNIYLAIGFVGQDVLEVYSTIGSGIDGFRDFVKTCMNAGVSKLVFGCAESNKRVQIIYRYAGAVKLQEIPNYYSNGETCYRYELDLKESKRLRRML